MLNKTTFWYMTSLHERILNLEMILLQTDNFLYRKFVCIRLERNMKAKLDKRILENRIYLVVRVIFLMTKITALHLNALIVSDSWW